MPTSSPPCPSTTWHARLPFFYGWVVVASIFVVMAVTYSVYYSFSVFFVALLEEYGWSRASTAGVFSLFVAVIGLGGVMGGALIDRLGPSRVIPAGGLLLALGLFACSRLTQLWEFYLYFGVVCGIALALAGWVPGVTVVSRWFSAKQGVAIGIASAGIGLGIVVFVPLSQHLISTVGWRSAYLVLAGLSILGIVPQAALLRVARPEELGLRPDGATEKMEIVATRRPTRTREVVDPEWASRRWSVGSAIRTTRFWLLTVALSLAVLTHQMIFVHQAAYLVDGGYDKMLAASVVGLVGLLSMLGKVFWGEVGDRLGRERAFTLGNGVLAFSILLLVATRIAPSTELVLLYALVFALGYAATPPLLSTAAADIFQGRSFGAIYGMICVGQGFGSAFGAWVAGYIFDTTGSYMVAFGVGIASAFLSITSLWLAAPRKVRRVRKVG
ncbi:MAG: MFS transporter [Chloroflexota bacterium]